MKNEDEKLSRLKIMIKEAIDDNSKIKLKRLQFRLQTLNNELIVINKIVNNECADMKLCPKIKSKKARNEARIEKHIQLCRNIENNTIINKTTIEGHEKLIAVDVSQWNNEDVLVSVLVKHTTVKQLLKKFINKEDLMNDYKNFIEPIIKQYGNKIELSKWLFCHSDKTVHNAKCTRTINKYFQKNDCIQLQRDGVDKVIVSIRVTIIVDGAYNKLYGEHTPINSISYIFHVLCESDIIHNNNNVDRHSYYFFNEDKLNNLFHKSQVKQWKIKATEIYMTQWNVENSNKIIYENDDFNDVDYNDYVKNRGRYGSNVFVYFPIKNAKYHCGVSVTNISAIGYHKNSNKFYGLVLNPDGTSLYEEISIEWIKDSKWAIWYTDPSLDIIEYIKKYGQFSFLKSICGAAAPPCDNNPICNDSKLIAIKYQQHDLDSCIFSSLSSVMYAIGLTQCAEYINQVKETYVVNGSTATNYGDLFSYLSEICSSKHMKQFDNYSTYKLQRLEHKHMKTFSIIEFQFKKGEFLIGSLWDDSGDHSHVCCFMQGYIFDSNKKYALILNQDNMNIVCQGNNFIKIKQGIFFHQRHDKPFKENTHNAIKRKRKRKIISIDTHNNRI